MGEEGGKGVAVLCVGGASGGGDGVGGGAAAAPTAFSGRDIAGVVECAHVFGEV